MFPQDIIDLFVQALHDQGVNLAPLLRVSRSFYYPAKRHIFRHLWWTFDPTKEENSSTVRLLEILGNNPSITNYIHCVSIGFNPQPASADEVYTASPKHPSFVAVLRILASLPIHTLELRGLGPSWYDVCISNFPLDCIEGLLRIRCNPSLSTLILHGLSSVPRPLIVGVPSQDRITRLFMGYCMRLIQSDEPLGPYSPEDHPQFLSDIISHAQHPPLSHLTYLVTPYPSTYFVHINPPPLLPALKTYAIDHADDSNWHWRAATSKIFATMPAVETLVLQTAVTALDLSDELLKSIRGLQKLRKIHLRNLSGLLINDPLPSLSDLFRQLHPLPAVETLVLELGLSLDRWDGRRSFRSWEWTRFKDVLLQTTTFITLDLRFTLVLASELTEREGVQWVEPFREELTSLAEDFASGGRPTVLVSVEGRDRESDVGPVSIKLDRDRLPFPLLMWPDYGA